MTVGRRRCQAAMKSLRTASACGASARSTSTPSTSETAAKRSSATSSRIDSTCARVAGVANNVPTASCPASPQIAPRAGDSPVSRSLSRKMGPDPKFQAQLGVRSGCVANGGVHDSDREVLVNEVVGQRSDLAASDDAALVDEPELARDAARKRQFLFH